MKHLSVAGKAVTVLLTAVLLAACSSSAKKDQEDAAKAAAAAQAEKQRQAAETAAQQQRLRAQAQAYGNVFYFDFDSYTLKPEAITALDAHIAYLKGNDEHVRLEGNTDERGTREYNMALGERRANAVRDYMVINGIADYRIETVSYGEERPAVEGDTEAAWSKNRRVELK